jgi:hypothetical protein
MFSLMVERVTTRLKGFVEAYLFRISSKNEIWTSVPYSSTYFTLFIAHTY